MKLFSIISSLLLFSSCQDSLSKHVLKDDKELKIENGILLYQENVFSGDVVAYTSKDIISYSCLYVNGKKQGEEKKWYTDGTLKMERYYDNGVKTRTHRGWWRNGNVKFVYQFNNKGQHDGIAYDYFIDGSPYRLFHYRKGKEEGSQKLYKPNGNIRANYVVVNGERFGLIGLKTCDAVSTM